MEPTPEDRCKSCGYDLVGLPAIGRCPECGAHFDRVTGENVLRPLTPEERGERLVRRIRTLALVVAAGLVLVCSGYWTWLHHAPRPFWIGAFIAGVLLLGALTSYVYEKDDQF